MDHDQYPKSITAAADILTNHRYDNYKQQKNGNQQKNNNDENNQKNNENKNETSFSQATKNLVRYCCGEKGHKSPDCPQMSETTNKSICCGSQIQQIYIFVFPL